MSWQSYVDAICNDPNISRAAILTRADGGYVASTEGFYPAAHEGTTESAILAAGAAENLGKFAPGLFYNGTKYVSMRSIPINDDVYVAIAGQSGEIPEGTKKAGLVVATTKTLILVGGYDDASDRNKTQGATGALTKMAEYLAEQGM